MTYEDFIVYSTITIAILFVILILWTQIKEEKRRQEINRHFKEFDEKIEAIRRGYEVREHEGRRK